MKVLIVDDERHVVDAIVLLVPWEKLGISDILTAFSVDEANTILERQRPEIAIIDVVINDRLGSEILSRINNLKLDTKVIVISGYDDYQYIRNMFVLGGLDYLLKPIEQEPLIMAVKTAIKQIDEKSGIHEKTGLSDYQRNLYRSLLLMTSHDEIYSQICEDNRKIKEADFCQILYADCFMLPVRSEGYLLELNKLLDVIRKKLESGENGTLFPLNTALTDIVILLYGDFTVSLEFIVKKVRSFNRDKKISLCFGCSERRPFPEGTAYALCQAKNGADLAEREEKREVIPCSTAYSEIKLSADGDKENYLFSAVLVGENIDAALSRWLLSILKNQTPGRGEVKKVWEHFRMLYEKWNRYFMDQYQDYQMVPFSQTEKLEALVETEKSMKDILQSIFKESLEKMSAEKRRTRNSRSRMEEVADYLRLNYNRKIQQAECAGLFHLNKDYLSRKFKEEMGIGVVEYVNQIRITKAKELLCNTDKNIQEISDEIGFADQKYFSRQFKRETSLSPTEYRMQNKGI